MRLTYVHSCAVVGIVAEPGPLKAIEMVLFRGLGELE